MTAKKTSKKTLSKTKTFYFRASVSTDKKIEAERKRMGHMYPSETLRMIVMEYFKK